jgi:cell division GTPase FtsZ
MNILLLSTGGGGGNILRSLKTLYRRDLRIAQKADPKYAERLRRAVATRFLDTNEFSVSDVPEAERLIVGATTTRRLGSMHNPEVAREALEESRAEVESLLADYSAVVLIGTGGKGTGAGTIFPLAQMARSQKKLVIPVFVRPSFEWHEVEKRRYDHALNVAEQFDAAGIRMIEIVNDRAYSDTDPQPQSLVWEGMNRPIARGLRGLLYVLWDLSQVDPSDLSALFAGHGRLRIGFSEIDPPAGQDPRDEQIDEAVRACWDNRYYAFTRPVGTSLVCVQGDWSNVVDGRIKGRLATLALSGAAEGTYNPLYARAHHAPKPWGVTALFAEYTGNHPPLEITWPLVKEVSWPLAKEASRTVNLQSNADAPPIVEPRVGPAVPILQSAKPFGVEPPQGQEQDQEQDERGRTFSTLREFAVALNRLDPAAVALADNGASSELSIDVSELRKLLGTVWFRSVFARLSNDWRDRLLAVLVTGVAIPDHPLRSGRKTVHLSELTFDQLKQIATETIVPDAVRVDLQLLVAAGSLWGAEVLRRFVFVAAPETYEASTLSLLLQPFRNG